jgi:hypothetical protein
VADPGYVYFARLHAPVDCCAGAIVVKVGKSGNPTERLKDFVGYPWRVELIHVIQTDDMGWLEPYLHRVFASWRMEGEWFQLPAGLVDFYRMQQRMDRPVEPSLFPAEVAADAEVARPPHRTLFDG